MSRRVSRRRQISKKKNLPTGCVAAAPVELSAAWENEEGGRRGSLRYPTRPPPAPSRGPFRLSCLFPSQNLPSITWPPGRAEAAPRIPATLKESCGPGCLQSCFFLEDVEAPERFPALPLGALVSGGNPFGASCVSDRSEGTGDRKSRASPQPRWRPAPEPS